MHTHRLTPQTDKPRLTPVDSAHGHLLAPEQPGSGAAALWDYWRIFKRYRWTILGITLIGAILGTFNAISATSIYRAQTRLLVKFDQPNISSVQQFDPMPMHWLYFETQADIIKSRAVAERVIGLLGLKPAPAVADERDAAPSDTETSFWAQFVKWFSGLETWLPEELRIPEPEPLDEKGRYEALVDSVLGGLTVSGGQESEVLVVGYVSADPKMAASFANAFSEAYIQFGLESRSSNVQQATSWLGRRIEELRNKVIASESALREFQAREDLVDSTNREKIITAKLGTLTAELIKAEAKHNEAKIRYQHVKSHLNRKHDYESAVAALNSSIVLEAQRNKVALERRVTELEERYGEKHPKMIGARSDLQEANRRLKIEVDKAIDNARKEYELAAAQERQLRNMIDQQHTEMRTVSGKAFELRQLEREVDVNRSLYETFLARFKEADVADEYDVPNAQIIDRATVPAAPFQPNRERMVFIATIIALVLGSLLAFLRDHFDNTFKTTEDVEDRLKLPVIGMVPLLKQRQSKRQIVERQVLSDPRSHFAEAINDIRTAILFSHIDQPPKVVLITSAVPGEGKTTLASNLALSFCRRGRTLLLDGDLRKGRIEEISNQGQGSREGLTDMLSGQCTIEEAIKSDPHAPNLNLLLAGTSPPNPLEVVSSKRFSECLTRLRNDFDYIVIDGSPLLPVSDSIILARLVDATVLTVKADDTPQDYVLEALKRVQSARIRPIGVALQQVDIRKVRGYARRYTASYNSYYGHRGSQRA